MRPLTENSRGRALSAYLERVDDVSFHRNKKMPCGSYPPFPPDPQHRVTRQHGRELQGHRRCDPSGHQRTPPTSWILQLSNDFCRILLLSLRFGAPRNILHDLEVSPRPRGPKVPHFHGSEASEERFPLSSRPRLKSAMTPARVHQ